MLHFRIYACIILAIIAVLLFTSGHTKIKRHDGKYKSVVNDVYEGYKAELGRSAWTFLHNLGSKFPQNPTMEEKERYLNFVIEFSKLYPCPECRQDFQKILSKFPPKVSSNFAFNMWLCHVHNLVNTKLGKPEFDCGLLQERWSDCGCSKEKVGTGDTGNSQGEDESVLASM